MINTIKLSFLIIISFLFSQENLLGNNQITPTKLICAVDVFDVEKDAKVKKQKKTTQTKRKKNKSKKRKKRNKKKLLFGIFGVGLLGFLFRKKKRRKKKKRRMSSGDFGTFSYVVFMLALGLGGSGLLALLFGFPFWTGVLWGLIAFGLLALIIGIFALALKDY